MILRCSLRRSFELEKLRSHSKVCFKKQHLQHPHSAYRSCSNFRLVPRPLYTLTFYRFFLLKNVFFFRRVTLLRQKNQLEVAKSSRNTSKYGTIKNGTGDHASATFTGQKPERFKKLFSDFLRRNFDHQAKGDSAGGRPVSETGDYHPYHRRPDEPRARSEKVVQAVPAEVITISTAELKET